jgi:protocatechuate 3,4-dioxygenase beta subunit
MAVTRTRLVIAAVVLATIALFVRGHSEDETPSAPTALQAAGGSHARTRVPGLTVATASIAGTIRDDGGRGLAGALICARSIDALDPITCSASDARGVYHVDTIAPGALDVWATARARRPESYVPRLTVAPGEHRDHVDLVLHAGGVEVHGTVRAVGGHPIAGARVEIGGLASTTDEAGRYSMWVRPSWAVVQVSAEHYANGSRGGPAPGQLDITLSPGSRITGIVVDDAGQPVVGATVSVNHADVVHDGSDAYVVAVLSDERGHFTLTGIQSGRYEVSARASHGYGIAKATPVAPGVEVDGVVVRLAPGFEVIGHVTTPGGAICVDSAVWLEDARARSIASTHDDDGTLHVGGLSPGEYAVYAVCADHVRKHDRTHIVVADHDVEATWSVETGATIRGRIVTSHGRPVAGVDVYVMSAVKGIGSEVVGLVQSNTDGTYAVHGVPAGHYEISTTGWTSTSAAVTVKATVDVAAGETTTHDFEIDEAKAGSYAGHVVDSEGVIPHSITVALRSTDQSQSITATVDDAGNFVGEGIPIGTYKVTVDGDEGELAIVGAPLELEIRPGATSSVNLVVTRAAGTIRGRVVDDLGEPAGGVTVVARPHSTDTSAHFETSLQATTDTDGRFAITHLIGTEYDVRAFRREGVDTILHGVTVGSDVTLQLVAGGSLAGTAHRSSGQLGELDVQVFDRRDDTIVVTQTFPHCDGHFDIADLPPGDYLVSVSADGSQGQGNVTVTSGEQATIDLALPDRVTLVGRVIDARTGAPVPAISISAGRPESSAFSVTTNDDDRRVTGADGRFMLVGVPRGLVVMFGSPLRDSSVGWVEIHRDTTSGGGVIDVGDVPVVTHGWNQTGGCGCTIGVRADPAEAVVVGVNADSAAEHAGLVDEDVITAIDGVDTTGDRAGLAALLINGDVGTTVEVTLQRGDTLELVRTP